MTEIETRTDEFGVSHVFADDWRSLAYGQGYVQARDRSFQMDVLRHVGRGNSAKVLGPSQLPSDVQVTRDLYSAEELERQYANASRRFQDVFEGFAEGVNRAMTEMIRERDVPGSSLPSGISPSDGRRSTASRSSRTWLGTSACSVATSSRTRFGWPS